RDRLANTPGLSVKLRRGSADVRRFDHDVARLAHGGNVGAGSVAETIGPITRATHPQAVAPWLFAGLAAVAGILIFGQALARLGLAPTAVAGTRLAFEPGRGRTAVPVRSALAGTALAVTAVIAAITFAGSFQHLYDTPRLYGWNWDAAVGNPYIGDISKRVVPTLPGKPYVGAVAG